MNKDDALINAKGFLESDGHRVYWEDWGNPKSTPIMYFHGGPGGGCDEKDKEFFDPKKHRVIFHDQRGSGRSTPFAETKNNTTQDLIKDAEELRKLLGIESMYVYGRSWGSALSLFYALAHPERVKKLSIGGVFLARQFEVDFVNEGVPRYSFPDAWERFISHVPIEHRKTGDDVMRYYADQMRSADKVLADKFAVEWSMWELSLCSIDYDQVAIEKRVREDKNNMAVSILETHYLLNKCFVPENYILENIDKIKHIPCVVIQGRFDMCTPAISAYDLSKVYGRNLELKWANAGHMSTDMGISELIKKSLLELFN